MSETQARGYEPLDKQTKQKKGVPYRPQAKDLEVTRKLRTLDTAAQNEIETFIDVKVSMQEAAAPKRKRKT